VPARAEDWPAFGRDATRNAVSPEKGPSVRWQVEQRNSPRALPLSSEREI
jgi:hypothetical protein